MKQRLILVTIVFVLAMIASACGPAKSAVTVEPTRTPIPGWSKYTSTGFEMWFPESWEGGSPANDLDLMVSKIRALGPEFEQMAQSVEANPNAFVLFMYDKNVGENGQLTNANIAKEDVMSSMTLDTYAEMVKKQLPSSFEVTKQENITLNNYDATRLEVSYNQNGISANILEYLIKNGNTIWAVAFTTPASEYQDQQPVFEQIANTVSLEP